LFTCLDSFAVGCRLATVHSVTDGRMDRWTTVLRAVQTAEK